MKVEEARDKNSEVLYYYVTTDLGTRIASFYKNITPIDGDEPITLEKAKQYAELFASSQDKVI